MSLDFLLAYQANTNFSKKISSTKLTKVSYLLKLQGQSTSLADLDKKHKDWAQKLR
tara:strand:- start:171 stop:338 length:168 start_codon:yes stop_codon:yes gene_type:complete